MEAVVTAVDPRNNSTATEEGSHVILIRTGQECVMNAGRWRGETGVLHVGGPVDTPRWHYQNLEVRVVC